VIGVLENLAGRKSMNQLLCAACAVVFGLLPAWAQDEPLPDNVAQAYVAYETAMQAQDYPAAEQAAETAWRAARRARIDRDLVGVLAANYGELAGVLGHHEEAYEAWRASAEIADQLDNAPQERAQRWYMASLAALSDGDLHDARSCSSKAVRIIDRNDDSISARLSGDANYLLARTSGQLGRFARMGEAAREALDAFEISERNYDSVYADAYYLSGVDHFFYGDGEDAAYHFQMARGIYERLGEGSESDALTSRYWVTLARRELSDAENLSLDGRIDASSFPRPPSTESGDDEVVTDEAIDRDDANNHDASPIRRTEPTYPVNAAMAALDGIVMVEFAVTPDGRTDEVNIVAAAPPGVFDEVTLQAVRRWRYEPKRVDGEAVRRDGIITQFMFTMCDLPSAAACRRQSRETDDE
jgi:TonB family protein